MTKTCPLGFLVFLLATCLAGAASADIAPPEVAACSALAPGDPCSNGTGTCRQSTCSRGVYTGPDQDAGVVSYACLTCAPNGDGNDKSGDSSGCAVGGRFASAAGPWLLAGAFGAGVMLLRRRSRR